jgi:hypothetical protein
MLMSLATVFYAVTIWMILVYINAMSINSIDHVDRLWNLMHTMNPMMPVGLINLGLLCHLSAALVAIVLALGPDMLKMWFFNLVPALPFAVYIILGINNRKKQMIRRVQSAGYGEDVAMAAAGQATHVGTE